jgi:hypothetical protein
VPFGTNSVLTDRGKAMVADRIRTTPATYTARRSTLRSEPARLARDPHRCSHRHRALSTEVETRTSGTESVQTGSVTGDTFRVVGTVTATGTRAVDEAGLFDASSTGNMFDSFTFPVVSLASGDSLTLTINTRFS